LPLNNEDPANAAPIAMKATVSALPGEMIGVARNIDPRPAARRPLLRPGLTRSKHRQANDRRQYFSLSYTRHFCFILSDARIRP